MISINLLRISPDSKYLEFSVECPINYKFNKLYIKRYSNSQIFPIIDASNLYVEQNNELALKHVMRINVTALGGTGMFQIEFGATQVDTAGILPNLDIIGICSDINNVYDYLLNKILKLNVRCIDEKNFHNLTQNYLFLYAHTEAMRLEYFDEAAKFYDILSKNF